MSDVIYTVLISPAAQGPWGDRRLAPTEIATLYVGGSGKWVFTNLDGRSSVSVRPAGPESEAGALLVGLAAGLGGDSGIRKALESRPEVEGGSAPIDVVRDGALIEAATAAVSKRFRLSIAGEPLCQDPEAGDYLLEGLTELDAELLVPHRG